MKNRSAILGAAFLMATSAIGPGFLTITSKFTQELLSSFGFVILISVLLDIGAQLNIWKIITVSGRRAQDLANKVLPGLGYFLAGLIAFGGLAFNVGNIAGCGLGAEVLTGLDPKMGAVISCIAAVLLFWYRQAGKLIDRIVRILGLLMIALTVYIAISSHPPVGEALYRSILPEKINIGAIVTLVGGTVGGYISFAGAHRLLDADIKGKENLSSVTGSAVSGILITSLMRFILFFAALGIVSQGFQLSSTNPAASVFQSAAGNMGYKFFGIVLWCAAITSVVGASYTSVSFWKTLSPLVRNNEKVFASLFIILATIIFITVGNPVKLLVLAGALNGLILPLALAIILIAATRPSIMYSYRHPLWLSLAGWIVVAVVSWLGYLLIKDSIYKL